MLIKEVKPCTPAPKDVVCFDVQLHFFFVGLSLILSFWYAVSSKSPKPQKPREKKMRVWDMSGTSSKNLDYSERNGDGSATDGDLGAHTMSDPVGPVKDV